MDNKIIYLPMHFGEKDWQTNQAEKEKKLLCGWHTSELYPLIKTTYQKIQNASDLVSIKKRFVTDFKNIVSNTQSDYYEDCYKYWFFDNNKDTSGNGAGHIFRFLSIKKDDLVYIKTEDSDIIYIAYSTDSSNIGECKTFDGYDAYSIDNIEFSDKIKKSDLIDKCYGLLTEKYSDQDRDLLKKNKTFENKINSTGTCLYLFDSDLKLKDVFYEALNSYISKKEDNSSFDYIINNEKDPEKKEYNAEYWVRNTKVKNAVLNNAKGICEVCQKQSFEKENGEIYLEVHHKIYLSQGGKDTIENCVALCPNCHKNEHFGKTDNRRYYKEILNTDKI